VNLKTFWKQAQRGEMKFVWVDLNDDIVCPDCFAIGIQQNRTGYTWDEWVQFGLPGAGHTVCRGACRCRLAPVPYLAVGDDFAPPVEGAVEIDRTFHVINYGGGFSPVQRRILTLASILIAAGIEISLVQLQGLTLTQQEQKLLQLAEQYDVDVAA
jgi:hypothetical protein